MYVFNASKLVNSRIQLLSGLKISMKQNSQDKKLEQENKELKELLRIAELRADLWQHAIEIAEQKLDIDIVKKYGAQQLHPSKSKGQKKK